MKTRPQSIYSTSPDCRNTIESFIEVEREEVAFVCSILESYEGMLAVRTPDPQKGGKFTVLKIMISPSFKKDCAQLIKDLKKEVRIKFLKAL